MHREEILIIFMTLMSLLLVATGDKQIVHILEGKLFREKRDISEAVVVYKRHKSYFSVLLFTLGFIGIAVSVISYAKGNAVFPFACAFSIMTLGGGIWGRINSFRAADRDLKLRRQ